MRQLFTSTRVVLASGVVEATVVVEGERVSEVVPGRIRDASPPVVDFGDAVLMAGLVDTHVHVNEPGRTEWEGFETATRAAAAGGITTIVDMPLNCIPVTTCRSALEAKLSACADRLWVDCGFWGGVVPGNAGELGDLAAGGVLGAKAFLCDSGIDDFPRTDERDLREAMVELARAGLPLLVHAELVSDTAAVPETGGAPQQYATYLASRPPAWEERAVALMIDLCRTTGCRVHVVHLSSASALDSLARARAEGLPISVETCPHYLCLSAEQIADGATEFKCAPPIREDENRQGLWRGLRLGIIDSVVSDHSPCTPELKGRERGDFLSAWGGIASLQFGLCSVWTEAQARDFGLVDIARWMSRRPAELFGLSRKGEIAAGKDADLVVWAPEMETTIREDIIHHRHKISPYVGRRLSGRVLQTWLRGQVVYSEAGFGERRGRPLLRANIQEAK